MAITPSMFTQVYRSKTILWKTFRVVITAERQAMWAQDFRDHPPNLTAEQAVNVVTKIMGELQTLLNRI